MNRRAALLAVLAAAAWSAAVPAGAPAVAAACSGVTVVVDFGSLGGARTGCFAGDPASGLAALSGAGFSYAFVPRQPGLVCQIQALPDPCNGAPTHAYWSYWYAQPGGSWVYSSTGAAIRDPAPGGVEGWAFGAGAAPGLAPPAAAPPPPPPPAPPPPPPPVAQPPATSAPGAATSRAAAATSPAGGSSVSVSAAEPVTGVGTTADSSRAAAVGPTGAAPSAPGAVEPVTGRGVPLGFIAGLVLLAVLGAGAWWVARRRTQGPPESP